MSRCRRCRRCRRDNGLGGVGQRHWGGSLGKSTQFGLDGGWGLKVRKFWLEMGPMRRCIRAVLLLNLLALVPNCQTKKDGVDKSEATTATSSNQPVGKVAQAVANAVEAGGPATAASSGPPPDGILDPARAEAEAPSGSAPKLSLGANGSEPRVTLRSPNAALPRNLKLEVTLQAGVGQGLPPIEIALGLESKPGPASGGQAAGKPDAKALSVTARVRDVKVAMPNVPEDFLKQIAELKGGKVTFLMAP